MITPGNMSLPIFAMVQFGSALPDTANNPSHTITIVNSAMTAPVDRPIQRNRRDHMDRTLTVNQ